MILFVSSPLPLLIKNRLLLGRLSYDKYSRITPGEVPFAHCHVEVMFDATRDNCLFKKTHTQCLSRAEFSLSLTVATGG